MSRLKKDFQIVHDLIIKHDIIVIFGHAIPDGDCYGSQIALRETLRLNFPNKKVYAVGSGLPMLFSRLGEMDIVEDEIIKKALAILVDVSDFHLVEDQRIHNAKTYLKIDHHYESNPFEYPKIVATNKVAASELIAEFINAYHLKINKTIAEALYLGIVTDSGRFLYELTNKNTFLTTAMLYDYDIKPKELLDLIYQVDEKYLKYRGYLLSNYEITHIGVIFCYVAKEVYLDLDIDFAFASSQVNTYSNIKGYPIYALFTEYEDGRVRVELRSNKYSVREVALKYGGGGHQFAAGVRYYQGGYEEALKIINDLDAIIKE